jgi:hypothetical protein
MVDDEASHAREIRLGRESGLGRPIARILAVWAVGGLLIAGLGISGLAEDAEGGIQVLSWLLTTLGFLVAIAAAGLLALGRRRGRSAVLAPAGITLPGRQGLVPWNHVEACVVRRVPGGQSTLFARFTPQYAEIARSEGTSLGRIPGNADSGDEILHRIESWRRAMPR